MGGGAPGESGVAVLHSAGNQSEVWDCLSPAALWELGRGRGGRSRERERERNLSVYLQ